MVQGTGLPFHCSLLNWFCPWTNSNSIYQHYLAENLHVGYIAVNLSGQTWRLELIHVSNCSKVCLYGYTSQSWCGEFGVWSTQSPHVDPSLGPATFPPLSTWRGRMSPSVPCCSQTALKGFCHPGRELPSCRLLTGLTSPLAGWLVLVRAALIKEMPQAYRVPHPLLFPQRCAAWQAALCRQGPWRTQEKKGFYQCIWDVCWWLVNLDYMTTVSPISSYLLHFSLLPGEKGENTF